MQPEVAIALPFTLTSYGSIGTTTDQSKIWADRVRSVIGTTLRERVMRPTFGTTITHAFMETQDTASISITSEVSSAFALLLPNLTLNSVDTSVDEYSGEVSATISYSLPNNDVVDTTVAIANVIGTLPPYEENQ